MRIIKIILIIGGLLIIGGCASGGKFERAQKRYTKLVTDYPQLVSIDSTTTTNKDTSIVEVEVEPEREVTRAKLDTFIHVICDTLTPPAVKEKAIRGLMQNCTYEGLMGRDTVKLYDQKGVEVKLLARGNKLQIANVITNTRTEVKGTVFIKESYYQKALDTWHVPAAAVGLVLFLLVMWKLRE